MVGEQVAFGIRDFIGDFMGLDNSEQQCTMSGSMIDGNTEVVLVLKIADCNFNP